MLNIYLTSSDGQFRQIDEIKKGCWINLIAPTPEEINQVVNVTGIPIDFIKDPLDDDERSRIEKEERDVLTIVDIPIHVKDDSDSALYDTIPIGIIVTDHYFVTVCLEDNPIINEFTQNRVKGFYTFKKTRFTLQLLYVMATYYLKYLRQINRRTNEVERELHESMKNKELFSLLSLEKTLVYFMTSLKANNIVMEKILRLNYFKMYEDDKDLLEDVMIEIRQALEMAEVYSNILNGLMDTFASVISNNVNIVMKFLTAITIVLSLPTMVASFFGMNFVKLPLEQNPFGFIIAILISVTLSVITALIFWKKRYF
ncbi:magnesium transporter [Pullulanibacillus pueri]|uniref:Magnesium transporter n=1 Tax=Pullulanibacillus pueri TaxID=1437324 RepID=A0A8J2ZTD5_9BACL|nr:magnesium transporter CorA family protein [Pullulanibacillus pueri]MBM7680241.1 magnesium transporter [Pullulanibacillus pueri]GGH76052.1 magnesium transporter [Pullulanibacillus pueri]